MDVFKLVALIPDTHRPFHHKKHYACMMNCLADLKPSSIYLLGDYGDFYWMGQHGAKDPRVKSSFEEEVIDINKGLDEFDDTFPDANKVYIEGNHEYRMERWLINRAPELFGVTSIKHIFEMDSRIATGWRWIDYRPDQAVSIEGSDLIARHEPPASDPKKALKEAMCSVVYGHIHRIEESCHRGLLGRQYVAFSCGWLGDHRKNEVFGYVKGHFKWQAGFALVWVNTRTGEFHHQIVQIMENSTCVVNGKLYRG